MKNVITRLFEFFFVKLFLVHAIYSDNGDLFNARIPLGMHFESFHFSLQL
jgi:hypothetical protein